MAGITRTTQALFSTTGLTGTGGFGAAANGTTTTEAGSSNTPANIMTGTAGAWAAGWLSAVLGASKFPAIEDMNAVNNVFSTQLAYILERGIPEYDAGTTYNTNDIARGVGLTTLYKSVGNSNTGNALSNGTYWTLLCDLAQLTANVFTGGTTTGSANAQVLASLSPTVGYVPNNGQVIVCTAGYTNTGAATLAITSPSVSATAINKNTGSGLAALTGGEIVVGETIYLTWNSTSSVFVLTDSLPLGTLANLGVGTWMYSDGTNLQQALPLTPQGRLSLTTGVSVMTADVTAATSVYYVPDRGPICPVYNGTQFVDQSIGSQLTLALDSNTGHTGYQVSGSLFDIFYANVSGTLYFGTGPAWTNATTRSAAISQLQGLWTNTGTMTLRFGSASGNTVSVPANQATYLGTMYATANGQTGVNFKPAAASGGSANIVGLWNAYNRVPAKSICRDSASAHAYGTNTWRSMNNNTANSVSWVDGLQQSSIEGTVQTLINTGASSSDGVFQIGINLDSTSATPNIIAQWGAGGTSPLVGSGFSDETFNPQIGFHYLQAMENALSGVSYSTGGSGVQALIWRGEY